VRTGRNAAGVFIKGAKFYNAITPDDAIAIQGMMNLVLSE
jgi:hypothetical protein